VAILDALNAFEGRVIAGLGSQGYRAALEAVMRQPG
jgi:3-dehydroquinate dehydratase